MDSEIRLSGESSTLSPKLKPKAFVSKACDRCRKRRARCDEGNPCRNCSQAGKDCTHDAPVLKRGPHPRRTGQTQSELEARVRNLEELIASIPGGAASASAHLSSDEVNRIRIAARSSPHSDPSPQKSPPNDFSIAGPSSWTAGTGDLNPYSMGDVNFTTGFQYQPALEPSASAYGAEIVRTVAGPKAQNERSAVSSGAGQDLLYKDDRGQTKFLGASSGMPLLDKLKTDPNDSLHMGLSLAEEWISLSAAIGMDVSRQLAPEVSATGEVMNLGLHNVVDEDDSYWRSLTAMVPEDLLDVLVRAYFTISHLLWPILHAPTFMLRYSSLDYRRNPSFVALVMSICSLSSRYAQDPRLAMVDANGEGVSQRLISLARITVTKLAGERTDLELVQAMFNMSVVQEGTARPNMLWTYLSQALSMAIDLGLHRRVDDYSSFSAVDIEVRKRTMWALYSQDVKASCTFGRPPLLRLTDLDLDEPSAVDDVYISVEQGIGIQPAERPSVMAGFVAAVRLHMILERTIRRINKGNSGDVEGSSQSFRSLLLPYRRMYRIEDELEILPKVTDDIPGDWNYTPATPADPDSVRFFQKTRIFTLQHFIRLLIARHRFSDLLVVRTDDAMSAHGNIQQIIQSALGIIGTYCAIEGKGRLGFFGAHAIAQLTQAGAGLIGVLLHMRADKEGSMSDERSWYLCMQGLPAAIQVLRQLGKRRSAGLRSAELLSEFIKACRIPVYTGSDLASSTGVTNHDSTSPVEIPMLRSLPRRSVSENKTPGMGFDFGADMEEWLQLALSDSADFWVSSSQAKAV